MTTANRPTARRRAHDALQLVPVLAVVGVTGLLVLGLLVLMSAAFLLVVMSLGRVLLLGFLLLVLHLLARESIRRRREARAMRRVRQQLERLLGNTREPGAADG